MICCTDSRTLLSIAALGIEKVPINAPVNKIVSSSQANNMRKVNFIG